MQCNVFGIALLVMGAPLTAQDAIGRVLDVLGDPIPAALVEVLVDGKTVRKTYADGEGVYMIPKLPALGASLRISAKGKASKQLQNRGPRTPKVRNATLLDAGKVHGRVTNANGQPVAGVAVIAVYGKDSLRTRTNASGHYVLDPVPLGRLTVHVRTGESTAQQDIRLRSESTCNLELPKGTGLPRQVRVQGPPAAMQGACVQLISADMALLPRGGRVPLADDGTAIVLINQLTVITPIVPGFVTDPLGRLATNGDSALRFVASRLGEGDGLTELKGKVRTTHNKVVRGQPLYVCDQSGRMLGTTTVDRSGNFKLRIVRPSSGFLRIGVPLDSWELTDDERTLRDGCTWAPIYASDDSIELWLQKTGTVSSAIRDAKGTLLALADVTIADPYLSYHALAHSACDRSGQLRIALPVADYDVLAVTPDGLVCKGHARIRAGGSVDVEWHTVATGAVTGIVVDSDGQPLPGIELFLAAREISNEHLVHAAERQMARITTDRRGHFRCRGLPPGDWTIVAPGEPDFATTELTIKTNNEISLQIEPR